MILFNCSSPHGVIDNTTDFGSVVSSLNLDEASNIIIIMNSRYVEITLDKAQEWYNKGGDLKEIALQAFTEKELNNNFRNLVCFKDVIEKLYLDLDDINYILGELKHLSPASAASFKINLIKQALNYGYKMNFTEGFYWIPRILAVKVSNNQFINSSYKKVAQIKINNELYYVYGGVTHKLVNEGLGFFSKRDEVSYCHLGSILGCATEEIAKHMSIYFGKEIFEAQYGDSIKYEWIH